MRNLLQALLLVPTLISSAAYSQQLGAANCLIFENPDLQGASWATQDQDEDVSKLSDWWQNRASSVWVEKGYVLELFSDINFGGPSRYIHGGTESSTFTGKPGTVLNLMKVDFDNTISSFKCRHVGNRLTEYPDIFYFMAPMPLFYDELSWTEIVAGPRRLWTAKMVFDEGDVILKIRVTYQPITQGQGYEYKFNMRTAAIHVHFENLGFGESGRDPLYYDKQLDYIFGHHNLEYRGALAGMEIAARQIAAGYDYGSGYVQQPSPELLEIADEFKRILVVQ